MPEAERLRQFRAHLEHTLQLIRAQEKTFYAFLGECAQLAADNMQDVRLEQLQFEIDALQTPPSVIWGEVLTNVALGFALEVGIVFGWHAIAAGVISVRGMHELIKVARVAEQEVKRTNQMGIDRMLAQLREAHRPVLHARKHGLALNTQRGSWFFPVTGADGVTTIPSHLYSREGSATVFEPTVMREQLRSQDLQLRQQIRQAELASVSNASPMTRVLRTYDVAVNNGDVALAAKKVKAGWGDWWEKNIGNEKGGVILDTTQNVLQAIESKLREEVPPGDSSYEPFLTSELTGRYLTWVADQRLAVVETYANQRVLLATVPSGTDY